MRKLLFFIIFICLGIDSTFACSCVPNKSPTESLENSNSVFVGKVVEITKNSEKFVNKIIGNSLDKISFEILENYKGELTSDSEIYTSMDGASCGYTFEVGRIYLVYTYKNPNTGTELVSLCSRTTLLENAKENLDEFSSIKEYYTSKEIFELIEGEKCESATDGCNSYIITDGKIGGGTKMFCGEDFAKWSCKVKNEESNDEEIRVCTMQYDPVCGVDGKTYGNSCTAGDVEIAYYGECKEVEQKYLNIIDEIVKVYKSKLDNFTNNEKNNFNQKYLERFGNLIEENAENESIVDRLLVLIGKIKLLNL